MANDGNGEDARSKAKKESSRGRGNRASRDWKREFFRLREALDSSVYEPLMSCYRHSILFFPEGLPCPVHALPRPEIPEMSGEPAAYDVAVKGGGRHVHFIFDEDADDAARSAFRAFISHVGTLQSIVEAIPESVLPSMRAASHLDDGEIDRALKWFYVLHWLGGQSPSPGYTSQVDFVEDVSDYLRGRDFRPWHEFPSRSDFYPIAFITEASGQAETYEDWNAKHTEAGKPPLPPVLSLRLRKPLLTATKQALIELTNRGSEFARRSRQTPDRRERQREPGLGPAVKEAVLDELLRHHEHGGEGGTITYQPLKQKKIVDLLGKGSQPSVHRAFKELMSQTPVRSKGKRPSAIYKELCTSGMIVTELKVLKSGLKRAELAELGRKVISIERLQDMMDQDAKEPHELLE